MGFFKVLGGIAMGVGAIVAAPIVLPAVATAAAAAGATAAAAAGTAAAAAGAAAATVGGAVAGTAVGGAAIGAATTAAATVGGAVGTAAGAVGLGTVAAATGTTAGAAAVGTITTSIAVGGAAGLSAKEKMDRAKEIEDKTKSDYEKTKKKFDLAQTEVNYAMKQLAESKKNVAERLLKFNDLFKKIKNPTEFGSISVSEKYYGGVDPSIDFDAYAITLPDLSKIILKSYASGNLVGLALTGGITSTITTAGTGTAMSALSGAAATNATMAALGGGTLASGGLGMAGGAIVAKGLVFAPALAIGGLLLSSKAGEALEKAEKNKREGDENNAKTNNVIKFYSALSACMRTMHKNIESSIYVFDKIWEKIYDIVYTKNHCDAAKMTVDEKEAFFAAIGLAKVMEIQVTKQFIKEDGSKTEARADDVVDVKDIEHYSYMNPEIAAFSALPKIDLGKLVYKVVA